MDKLVQARIIRSEDFEITPGERSGMMYKEQSCAMILKTQAAPAYAKKSCGRRCARTKNNAFPQ